MRKGDSNLTEYISRSTRRKLVKSLARKFPSTRQLARTLGVSAKAVRNWLRANGSHPSNPHLRRILAFSLKTNRDRTLALLDRDLRRHEMAIRRFLEEFENWGEE